MTEVGRGKEIQKGWGAVPSPHLQGRAACHGQSPAGVGSMKEGLPHSSAVTEGGSSSQR